MERSDYRLRHKSTEAQSSRIWFFKFRVENMANLAKSQLSAPTVLASSGLQICIYKCARLSFLFFRQRFTMLL